MATAVDIAVRILTKLDDSGLDQAQGRFGKFQSGLSKASKAATVGLFALGGAAVVAADAAAQDEQAQALLAKTMENSAGATKTQIAATEDWISAQSRATGIADDELRPALGALVRATGDVETSQKALKTAMDVSAATGKPLQAVSEAMAKGFGGTTGSLTRLVPGLSKAAKESGNMKKIMRELSDQTGGSAAAAADTAAGKFKSFKTQMGEAQEALGAGLLPIMGKLAGVLEDSAIWIQKNSKAFQIIAAVVGGFMTAIILLNAVVRTAAVLQAAWNLAMSLNPIGLIVIAIGALVVGLIVAYKKSETFRNIVNTAFRGVLSVAKTVWRWIKQAFSTLWSILKTPVKLYIAYVKLQFNIIKTVITTVFKVIKFIVTNAWSAIKTATKAVRDAVTASWKAIRDAVKTVVDAIKGVVLGAWNFLEEKTRGIRDKIIAIFQTIVDKVKGIFSALGDVIANALQTAISAINKLINAANKLPGVNIPTVPTTLAASPMSARALVPSGLVATPRVSGRSLGSLSASTAAPVVINVSGALDPDAVARQIRRLLNAHDRRVGIRT